MLLLNIKDFDTSYGRGSSPVYQHTGYYCKINGCLGYGLEGEGCDVNKDALPLISTLIPCCNINVHNSSRATY